MSALLPHIKSHRAMAKALEDQSHRAATASDKAILTRLSWAHANAADDLERQAQEGCSGETTPAEPRRKARTP